MLTANDVWVEPQEVAQATIDMMNGTWHYRGGDVLEVLSKISLTSVTCIALAFGSRYHCVK